MKYKLRHLPPFLVICMFMLRHLPPCLRPVTPLIFHYGIFVWCTVGFVRWVYGTVVECLPRAQWTSQVGEFVMSSYGPLIRYAKLRVAHAPGMSETFSPSARVRDPDMHRGTCMTHVPWCLPGSLTSGFLWSRWRGKVPGIPGAFVTRNFTYMLRGPWKGPSKSSLGPGKKFTWWGFGPWSDNNVYREPYGPLSLTWFHFIPSMDK